MWAAGRTSHTPAPESTVTVAPFRAWRGWQYFVAEEPARPTIVIQAHSISEPTALPFVPARLPCNLPLAGSG